MSEPFLYRETSGLLFVALQRIVLIVEGLWHISGSVPLTILGPVYSLLIAFSDSFLLL